MAIHYVSPMKHQKLWNKNGIRRSLLIGPSYDSNQQLFDEHTKRTIYRPHKDGTVIWHTDIVSADPTCPYGDKSKDLQKRRQKMWNDVMKLVTPKSPRCRAFFEYALPNSFSKEQAIQCAEEFAMNLSKRINTPVDFSIHYVPKNIHVHVGCPEWQWENGKFASKGVTYYVDKNDNPIKNGVFWDKKGYPLRNPIINGDKPIILRDVDGNPVLDKQGHIQFKNQLKTKRGERRWHRFKFENITKKDVAFIHSEVDRIINAELERSGSEERITRPNKNVRKKLKSLGLEQKHIGPQSYRTKDGRYQEISEHNKMSKRIENAIVSTLIQKEEVEELSSSVAADTAFIDNATVELAESEKKMETFKDGDNFVESYITNVIQPEYTFISDATEKYSAFLQEKQNALQPLIQLLDSNIDALTKEISAKSKKLKNTPRNNARIKLWNGNIKILKNFTSKLKQYSTKNFVKNIQKIAARRWQKLSPWSRVKYIETHQNATNAFIYAGHMDLDVEDKNYDNVPTPNALDLPNTTKWQKHTNNQNFIENIVTYDADYKPSISTERLSEIVSAESTLTETNFDDNYKDFAEINFNAPRIAYNAELASIAEQERIAEQKRIEEEKRRAEEAKRLTEQKRREEEQKQLAEQKAEQERIAREKARLEAEEREKRRKAEELRKQQLLAEQQRKAEEKRLAEEKAKQATEATATHRVADKPAEITKPVVSILTEEELQEKRKLYENIAALRDTAKEYALLQLATKICDYAHMQKVRKEIDDENNRHGFDDDYVLLKYPTEEEEIQKQIDFYRTHNIKFTNECKLHKIAAYFEYQRYSNEAQAIHDEIEKSLEAGKSQKTRKKSSSTTKTNTHTKSTRRHIIHLDGEERTKE